MKNTPNEEPKVLEMTKLSPTQEERSPSQIVDTFPTIESPSPRRVRSLRKIYEATNIAYFSCEQKNFNEIEREKIWKKKTMDEEMTTIGRNKTRELIDLPKRKEFIGLKWV